MYIVPGLVTWVNTVRLTAGKGSYPGDRFGYSIATRVKDNSVLIGKYVRVCGEIIE